MSQEDEIEFSFPIKNDLQIPQFSDSFYEVIEALHQRYQIHQDIEPNNSSQYPSELDRHKQRSANSLNNICLPQFSID